MLMIAPKYIHIYVRKDENRPVGLCECVCVLHAIYDVFMIGGGGGGGDQITVIQGSTPSVCLQ